MGLKARIHLCKIFSKNGIAKQTGVFCLRELHNLWGFIFILQNISNCLIIFIDYIHSNVQKYEREHTRDNEDYVLKHFTKSN